MPRDSNLIKCILTYPDAAMALAQFRDVVQQKCLTVFDRRLDALRHAVGYNGDLQPLAKYSYPDRSSANETGSFELGAKAVHGGTVEFCSRFYWYRDSKDTSNDEIGLLVSIWFNNAELRSQLMVEMKFAEADPRFRRQDWHLDEGNWLEIYLPLKKNEFDHFDLRLDKLLKWSVAAIASRPNVQRLVRKWHSSR